MGFFFHFVFNCVKWSCDRKKWNLSICWFPWSSIRKKRLTRQKERLENSRGLMPKTDKSRLDSPTVYGTLRNVDFSAAGGGRRRRRTAAEIKEWPSFKTYEKMRSIFFRLKRYELTRNMLLRPPVDLVKCLVICHSTSLNMMLWSQMNGKAGNIALKSKSISRNLK